MSAPLRVEFDDDELQRLACVPGSESARWGAEVVRGYRKQFQRLRAVTTVAELFAVRTLGARRSGTDHSGTVSIPVAPLVWLIATVRNGNEGGVVALRKLVTISEGSRHVR